MYEGLAVRQMRSKIHLLRILEISNDKGKKISKEIIAQTLSLWVKYTIPEFRKRRILTGNHTKKFTPRYIFVKPQGCSWKQKPLKTDGGKSWLLSKRKCMDPWFFARSEKTGNNTSRLLMGIICVLKLYASKTLSPEYNLNKDIFWPILSQNHY